MDIELNYGIVFAKLPILLEGCVTTLGVSFLSRISQGAKELMP